MTTGSKFLVYFRNNRGGFSPQVIYGFTQFSIALKRKDYADSHLVHRKYRGLIIEDLVIEYPPPKEE